MKKGITSLYSAFRHHVRAKKKIVAPLQILSRLEDYLTKEFAGVIMAESGNSVLPILNSGKKSDGRRIDLALAYGDFGQALDRASMKLHRPTIRGFIELKYVQNRHKYGYGDAQDEIAQVFKGLQKQMGPFIRPTYSNCPVKLLSHESCIYGVVLASYVR